MPSLKERRQALEADLQQLVGQINRTQGAMALLDELILVEEQKAARVQAHVDGIVAAREARDAEMVASFGPAPAANDDPIVERALHMGTCNCGECVDGSFEEWLRRNPPPAANDEPIVRDPVITRTAPEMLPVMRELEFPF